MSTTRQNTVVIIGTGNVAWSLAPAIDALEGYTVAAVLGRAADKAAEIAALCSDAAPMTLPSAAEIPDADIYIITVKDEAIAEVASKLHGKTGLVIHTSGGIGIEALTVCGGRTCVLYPLQTFTRGRALDFSEIPLFIEADSPEATNAVRALAEALSSSVTEADSERRKLMHAAAVFGCNFANFLWTKSQDLLESNGMDFNLLAPLIKETLNKAIAITPREGQTGPARRGDKTVISRHKELLSDSDARLYEYLSALIYDYYHS